ncbi:hypothetical protein Ssi03_60760 [Sphaerisporangium siamense]|uniref:Uncharacterized protein n=1 Tax=Sphaerisporangium siamense TaxID=795645 RepID=A0A7W7DAK3_9ACTN|nr:hypothetical protein [Sphaerisporangium siamense]MBB4703307.1 hypothetical protein [Sphaerisporangium siamense]GII88086.1 hypothetical protein Ssi03_60760 [Sphaerisporangium siamense]
MIRRLIYLGLGAYIGVWTMRKLQALKPEHVARRAADGALGLVAEARLFARDVRGLAAGREAELRARFALEPAGDTRPTQETHHNDVKDGR